MSLKIKLYPSLAPNQSLKNSLIILTIQFILFAPLVMTAMLRLREGVSEGFFFVTLLWYIPLWVKGLGTLIRDVDSGYDAWRGSLTALIYLLAVPVPGLIVLMMLK